MNHTVLTHAVAEIDREIDRLTAARSVLADLIRPPDAVAPTSTEAPPDVPALPSPSDSRPRRARVLEVVPSEFPVRVKEVATVLDEAQGRVHDTLTQLARDGRVTRPARGQYQRTRAGEMELETVWNGAMKRPLLDPEDRAFAQRPGGSHG